MLSLTVKMLDAYKFDGVAQSDNTARHLHGRLDQFLNLSLKLY